jgi:hypothetical protein
MKPFFLFLLFGLLCLQAKSQPDSFWHVLAQVNFKIEKDKNGYETEVPVFSNYLKTFQSKKIKLKGYVIPLDEVGPSGKFMLSALPFNLCYFCGAAGPETVVEVVTNDKVKFSSKPVVMEGILFLNATDPNKHIYVLQNARLLEP